MLSIICNLNIVHLIENHHISITGPKGMSDFHQIHHQQIYVKDYCTDNSPDVIEETTCAVCVKLTSIFEMVERSEVENINLLKVDGVTRKAKIL